MKSLKEQLIAIKSVLDKGVPQAPTCYLGFGKYRGCLVSTIARRDPEYLRWLLDQEWLDLEYRAKIEQTLALL